jgi:prolyl 4-hydroxylase
MSVKFVTFINKLKMNNELRLSTSNRIKSIPASNPRTYWKEGCIFMGVVIAVIFVILFIQWSESSKDGYRKPLMFPYPGEKVRTQVHGDTHQFTIEMVSDDPKVLLLHDFLTSEECDEMIKQAEDLGLNRSTVQGKAKNVVNKDRTSFTANLKRGSNDIMKRIERRVAAFSNLPMNHTEPFQVCRYHPGQQYKPHYDFFVPGVKGTDVALRRGGQRHVTFFVYLNDMPESEQSSHTHFPKIDLKVKPKKGMAAFWMNVNGDNKEDFRTLHAGTPPTEATKYGLNIWVREKPFA